MPDSSQIHAFYYPDPLLPDNLVRLSPDEERHMRACRLRPGDTLLLLDGKGERRRGVVERMDRHGSQIRITQVELARREGGPYIGLGIALLADRSRLEWVVEKGTELGIARISLLRTERSEGSAQGDRLHRIAISALKQSRQPFLPEIPSPVPLAQILEEERSRSRIYLCHEGAPADEHLSRILVNHPSAKPITLLIGPEGGFSDTEVEQGRERSARIVSLGPARLRADTAAVAAAVLATSLVT